MENATLDARQLRHEIYGARKVLNQAYADLVPSMATALPACSSRPTSGKGVPASPRRPIVPNPPRKRVVSAVAHSTRRVVSARATTSGNTPNRITTFAPPGDDNDNDDNNMHPPRANAALSQSSYGSSDTLFPLESSHHFQKSELARNISKWQAHALKLKEGSFKSVYRWAHHCIDTAASTMEVPAGGQYVGDDLDEEEGCTPTAGIEVWKASEEALGRRAGVACTVLDVLMSELCADSDLWAKLRPMLFGSIFQEWPSNLAEQQTHPNTGMSSSDPSVSRLMSAASQQGNIAAHQSFAGAYFGLKASYEDLTRRAFKQAASLQTVKNSFLTRVLRNRQDALKRAFLGWRGVVAETASRRNRMEATFATRNRKQILGSRFHTWKVIWIQTHHRRGRERRKSPKLAPTPTATAATTSVLDISTEGLMSNSLQPSVGAPANNKSDYVIKQQTGALATLQGLLAEEKFLRSRDFLSFTSEITSLNEQLSASSRTLTTTRGQKALWRSLWLTFHRDHCLPVPVGDHLASLIPRMKGATEYLLWFAQQRLDAALLLSEVHKVVSSSPDASVHLQSVLAASTSRRPSAVDSQQGEGKQERSKSIRSKRGSNTPNLTPQMSMLLTRAGENVFVSSSRTLLSMPAAPQCLVDVRGVWGEDQSEGLKAGGVGSMSVKSTATSQEGVGSTFPGIPHLESIASMQSGAVGREDSIRLVHPPSPLPTTVSHHRAIDEVFERNTKLLREELESVVVAWVNRLLTLREELVEREQGAKPEQRSRLLSSLADDLADGEIYLSLLDGIERAVVVHQPNFYDSPEPTSQSIPDPVDESGRLGRGPATRAAAVRAVVKALHQAVGRGGGPSAGPFPSWCQTPLSACTDPTLLAALFDPKRPLSKADNLSHLWILTTLLCDFSSRLSTPEETSEAYLPTHRSGDTHQLTLHLSPSSAESQSTLPPSPAVKLLLLNNRCFSNALPIMQGVSGASVIQAVQRASVIGSDAGQRSSLSVTDLKETDNNIANKSSRSGSDAVTALDATAVSSSTTQLPPAVDSNFLADPRLTKDTAQSSSMLSVASQISTSSPRLHVRRSTAAPTDGTLPGDYDVGSRKVPTPRPSFSGWVRQIPTPDSGEKGVEGDANGQAEGSQVEADAFGSGNPVLEAVPTISVQGGDEEGEEPLVISTPPSPSIQVDNKHIIDGIDMVEEQDSDSSLCQSMTLDGSGLHSTVMPLQLPQSQRGASPVPQPLPAISSAPTAVAPLRPRVKPALPPAVVNVGTGTGYIVQTESDAGPQGEFVRLAEAGPMGNPREGFVGLRWYRELNDSTAPLNTRDYEPPAVDSDQSATKVGDDSPVNEGSAAPIPSTTPPCAHPAFVEMPDLASSIDPSVVPPTYDALQWFELTKEARLRRQEWLALGRVVAAAVVGCRCLEEPKVLIDEVRTQSMVNSGEGAASPNKAQSTHLSVSNISRTVSVAKRFSAASAGRRRSDNTSTSSRVQTTSVSPQPTHPSPKQSRKVSAASTTSSSAPSRSGRDTPPHSLFVHGERRSLDPTASTPTPRAGAIVGLPSAPSPNGDLHAPTPTSRKGSNTLPGIPTTIQPTAFHDVITGSSFRKSNNL